MPELLELLEKPGTGVREPARGFDPEKPRKHTIRRVRGSSKKS
jgi:hypothetical protein